MHNGELPPERATDPAEFVESLRRLKDRSRFTYRQLEQRAAERGDVLARSTIADVLRRPTLPRTEVLAAFVRACGADDDTVAAWVLARNRLAIAGLGPLLPVASSTDQGSGADESSVTNESSATDQSPATGTAPPDPAPTGAPAPVAPAGVDATRPAAPSTPTPRSGSGRWQSARLLPVGAVVTLAAFALGAWLALPDDDTDRPAPDASRSAALDGSAAVSAPASSARIRPARTPALCLTEGRDRSGRYPHAVAAQRPCVEATPPLTLLEPVGGGRYFVKWQHADEGIGCLTVLGGGPAEHLIEPRMDCRRDDPAQIFRFEPTGTTPDAYRLRVWQADTELCVGLRGDDPIVTAEAQVEPCTGAADQEFLVGPAETD